MQLFTKKCLKINLITTKQYCILSGTWIHIFVRAISPKVRIIIMLIETEQSLTEIIKQYL